MKNERAKIAQFGERPLQNNKKILQKTCSKTGFGNGIRHKFGKVFFFRTQKLGAASVDIPSLLIACSKNRKFG